MEPTILNEYIETAEERIQEFSKSSGEVIGNMTMTAIRAELKTMFNMGVKHV